MKVGIIRCMQTEDYCPGSVDFAAIRNRKCAFSHVDENENIEVVGFVSCGGCPGKKILMRSRELQKRGADTIALASCITVGTPIGFACPHAEKIKAMLANDLDESITFLDHTH